ncbi:hypothetical protein ARMSODRAFT_1023736 [Armillaria solidipes]|uniref:Uncharacterized protein n=1 Tax=Armillaria solidipes TaxID=1076256 RepID=A0A2H3AYW6_9AGAR|nr:hypothetical protein ARMSODRAFT_1023736 [Armillaria solidipes]
MSNTDAPSSVFFKEEYEGEQHAMTLSSCISVLVAARETDKVNVIRLEHIKYTSGWLHEAILVELQEVDPDAATPRKAYALIDRDADQPPPKKKRFFSSSSSSIPSGKARDSVKLSRDKRSFTSSSDQYEVRRSIDFTTHPLPFVKLLVAASIVAETKPKYNAISAQCYWYAESVWDVVILHLQKVWPASWEEFIGGSRTLAVQDLARVMFSKFEVAWTKMEADIKKRLQDQRHKEHRDAYMEGVITGREEAAREKEDLKRKNAALEARLKLLEAQQGK